MYLYIFQIAVLLWGGKKKKYIFLKLNYPTFINLSHYPRLSPHLAHRCQITAQANSWSPSPKDFQLLWSTHYAQFSSSDSYIHPRGGGGECRKYTNSYDMKYNKKNEIQFLFWDIHGILKLQLSEQVWGMVHKCPHPTPGGIRRNSSTRLRGLFIFK